MATFTLPQAVPNFVIRTNTLSNKTKEIVDSCRKYMTLPLEIESNVKYSIDRYCTPYFRIFVDLKEPQPENAFIGYCMLCGIINRSVKIKLDYASFFPTNQSSDERFDYRKIDNLKATQGLLLLEPSWYNCCNMSNKDEQLYIHFFSIKKSNASGNVRVEPIKDDYGKIFSNFKNITSLSIVDIPEILLNKEYILTDMERFAPMSTDDTHCVLYVEAVNTVKVLRWIPQEKKYERYINLGNGLVPRGKKLDKINEWGDYFFELGYLQYDKRLYEFMLDHNSKILFATKHLNRIKLIGGLDIFLKNRFYYPKCISKIPIV